MKPPWLSSWTSSAKVRGIVSSRGQGGGTHPCRSEDILRRHVPSCTYSVLRWTTPRRGRTAAFSTFPAAFLVGSKPPPPSTRHTHTLFLFLSVVGVVLGSWDGREETPQGRGGGRMGSKPNRTWFCDVGNWRRPCRERKRRTRRLRRVTRWCRRQESWPPDRPGGWRRNGTPNGSGRKGCRSCRRCRMCRTTKTWSSNWRSKTDLDPG